MKEILLTQGQIALVDDEWFEYLMQWNWYAYWCKNAQTFYAARSIPTTNGGRTLLLMHRVIMNASQNIHVDHVNHVGIHNWLNNLRLATPSQQRMNTRKQCNTSSIYKGVSWHSIGHKWRAVIMYQKKQISLGLFNNEIEAALKYDNAARQLFGEFAYCNFQ